MHQKIAAKRLSQKDAPSNSDDFESACMPSDVSCERALASQLQAAARIGDVAVAERIFAEMVASDVKPHLSSYGALVGACAKAGDVVRAEQWLKELLDSNQGKPNAIC